MHVELPNMTYWFHESVSCLHDCMAMVLLHYKQEPIEVLGARWSFFHNPADVSQEEFYYPSPTGNLGRDLAPFHELRATWRTAKDGDDFLDSIYRTLDEDRPVIVVEDNFYMPNRPAFNDVHAAHLVVVTGYEIADGSLQIMESTPPLFRGPISSNQLLAAVRSINEARTQSRDFFFAGSQIGLRWIEVEEFDPLPPTDGETLRSMLERNVDDFLSSTVAGPMTGIAGLETYLRNLVSDTRQGNAAGRQKLAEIYTVGWAHLAQTALHAEFLKNLGKTLECPQLLEAARRVDGLAAQWTAFRLFGAHGAHGEISIPSVIEEIESRIDTFVVGHLRAIAAIEQAIPHIAARSHSTPKIKAGSRS